MQYEMILSSLYLSVCSHQMYKNVEISSKDLNEKTILDNNIFRYCYQRQSA